MMARTRPGVALVATFDRSARWTLGALLKTEVFSPSFGFALTVISYWRLVTVSDAGINGTELLSLWMWCVWTEGDVLETLEEPFSMSVALAMVLVVGGCY